MDDGRSWEHRVERCTVRGMIRGGMDHVAPASLTRADAHHHYRTSTALTEDREFPERSHDTLGQAAWEVADDALEWALSHVAADVPAV